MLQSQFEVKKIQSLQKKLNWYAFYTRPRAEKQACKELKELGYEVFLPIKRELHEWKNRQKKLIELPLIPGYIFVFTNPHDIYNIEIRRNICFCLKIGSNPSIIKEEEISLLRKMVDLQNDIIVDNSIIPDTEVKILSGPFKGYTGLLAKRFGKNRFGVFIESLNQFISIEIINNCMVLV